MAVLKFFFQATLASYLTLCFLTLKASGSPVEEAEKHFQAGEWAKSSQILKESLKAEKNADWPGEFYFNLGTALALQGALGEAYVMLMRASFSQPFDGDIRHHIRKVEQALPNNAKLIRPSLWFSFWPHFARTIPWQAWLLVALIGSAISIWLIGRAEWPTISGTAFLATLLYAICLLSWMQSRLPVAGATSIIRVKSGPGNTYTDITTLEPGALVNEDGKRDGWIKIRFKKGNLEETVGWVEPGGLLEVR